MAARMIMRPGAGTDRQAVSDYKSRHSKRVRDEQHKFEVGLSHYPAMNLTSVQSTKSPLPCSQLCISCRAAFDRDTSKQGLWKASAIQKQGKRFILHRRKFVEREMKDAAEAGCFICLTLVQKLGFPSVSESATDEHYEIAFEVPFALKSIGPPDQLGRHFPEYRTKFYSRFFFRFLKIKGPAIVEVSVRQEGQANIATLHNAFELRPARDIAPLSRTDEMSSRLITPKSLNLARRWLSICHTNHDICGDEKTHRNMMPTRLLKVGKPSVDGDFPDLRVEPQSSLQPTSYATLSYCWGVVDTLRLLTTNFEDLAQQVPFRSLGKTIQDAIIVTYHLGLDYLWVDALCIIQDSPDSRDWISESARMGVIYGNSTCTIAAAASRTCLGGLDRERDPNLKWPPSVKVNLKGVPQGNYTILDAQMWQTHIMDMPWYKRGWIVQEYLLSPRTLYFSESEMFWECRSFKASETYPGSLPGMLVGTGAFTHIDSPALNSRKLPTRKPLNLDDRDIFRDDECFWELYDQWRDIVQWYSKCSLSKLSDKLVAIHGVAKHMMALMDDTYHAGLWKRVMTLDLLWNVLEESQHERATASSEATQDERAVSILGRTEKICFGRSAEYRAPTWSWASVDKGVEFGRHRNAVGRSLSTILDVETTALENGQVESSWLYIRGPVTELHFIPSTTAGGPLIRLNGRRICNGRLQIRGKPCLEHIITLDNGGVFMPVVSQFLMLFCRRTYGNNPGWLVHGLLLCYPSRDFLRSLSGYGQRAYMMRIGILDVLLSDGDFSFHEREHAPYVRAEELSPAQHRSRLKEETYILPQPVLII